MEDISSLIKEAKPLYFARKKRNARIKTALAALVVFAGIGHFYSGGGEQVYEYYWNNDLYAVNESSVIEDMGLPTDEYGLLMVG